MQSEATVLERAVAPKRVVIVEDSATMRLWLRRTMNNDPRLTVVGEAANASQARTVIKTTKPDVVTLDVELPGMNGLDFLDRLMRLHPLPVVMVSSFTDYGSDTSIRALSLGAVDCIPKPLIDNIKKGKRDLVRRVFSAACSEVQASPAPAVRRVASTQLVAACRMPIVLIGASTGGVSALEYVLETLNTQGPPVVIVQHMPAAFLVSFSQMLNRKLVQDVGLLRDQELILPGQIRFAPALGRSHSEVSRKRDAWVGSVVAEQENSLHCPSVERLFASASADAADVIAVMLTGLGRDGADAMKVLRDGGARTIGQDEKSSAVYGMPRAAFDVGAVEKQLPVDKIGFEINALIQAHQEKSAALL